VPGDYYDRPLEWRQGCLAAASTDHLCKSIIMENTKAHPSVKGWEDPNNSKYYVVIVQVRLRSPLCGYMNGQQNAYWLAAHNSGGPQQQQVLCCHHACEAP
jgi:hypothetical protein